MIEGREWRELLVRLRGRNVGSIISTEIIAIELRSFLQRHYHPEGGESLLDLGAGTRPYAPLYERCFARCMSVDVQHSPHDISGVDRLASADDLPFGDDSFQCIVCTEVLEHCSNPLTVMSEVARVLRPGGRVFLTTPFLVALHEMPYDYYRYTPSALRDLAEGAGLCVDQILPRGDWVAVTLLALQLPLTKLFQRLSRLLGGWFYDYSNPLIYATVIAPQAGYLALWRAVRRKPNGGLAGVHRALNYHALGYVSAFQKTHPSS